MFRKSPLITSAAFCLLILFSHFVVGETKTEIMLESTSAKEASKPIIRDAQIEKPRGQLLYETHCNACHDDSVHGRNPRKAESIKKIKYFVTRWSKELNLKWTETDIDVVTDYVNSRYYQYEK